MGNKLGNSTIITCYLTITLLHQFESKLPLRHMSHLNNASNSLGILSNFVTPIDSEVSAEL